MSKWLSIMRKDGATDPYAIGYCSHSVASIGAGKRRKFEGWKLGSAPARLGSFKTQAEAKAACELDAKGTA